MRMALMCAMLAVIGCGKGSEAPTEVVPEIVGILSEVRELVVAGGADGRPATSMADLTRAKEIFPKAYKAVSEGVVVVVFNNALIAEGDIASGKDTDPKKVIAYEKKLASERGYALFNDGSVKEIDPAEFAKMK
jgi:hypothetical protein